MKPKAYPEVIVSDPVPPKPKPPPTDCGATSVTVVVPPGPLANAVRLALVW